MNLWEEHHSRLKGTVVVGILVEERDLGSQMVEIRRRSVIIATRRGTSLRIVGRREVDARDRDRREGKDHTDQVVQIRRRTI